MTDTNYALIRQLAQHLALHWWPVREQSIMSINHKIWSWKDYLSIKPKFFARFIKIFLHSGEMNFVHN